MAPQDKTRQLAEEGWCVIPDVLSARQADDVRERLWAAAEESERRGAPTRNIGPGSQPSRMCGCST